MNCIDYFDHGYAIDPAAPCMIDGDSGDVWDYARVRRQTLQVGNALNRRGYGAASRAAVLSYNRPSSYATVLGIMRSGVTFVPINPRNAAADNAAILDRFECDVLFYLEALRDEVTWMREATSSIKEFVSIDGSGLDSHSLAAWTFPHDESEIDLPDDPEKIFAIQATGGTTGLPKGVLMTNRSLENTVATFLAVAPSARRPVFLAVAPLTHAAGMVMQTILAQAGCAVMYSKVDKQAILRSIPLHAVTHTFLPPTVIYDLLDQPNLADFDYSSLQHLFYGSSPMSPKRLGQAINAFGNCLSQIYGQTESGVPNTFLSPDDHWVDGEIAPASRLSSCGRPTPFSKVTIIDDRGDSLPRGTIGEIAVRGGGVSPGYFNDPQASAEAKINGWHRTGDVGFEDDEGFFHIVDRKKDMIISGGFNIYSAEVEAALGAHAAVQACAVIGVPDPKWGEIVKAVVEVRNGYEVTDRELIDFCKTRIGSMKAPKSIDFIEALPRSSVGKVLKRDLRSRYWAGRDRLVS